MWPTSTVMCLTDSLFRLHVSIAQARCGLLPLVSCPVHSGEMCSFNRSSAMWPTSTSRGGHYLGVQKAVSIAQARCGLLPRRGPYLFPARHLYVSIAQARCGLLPRQASLPSTINPTEFQSLKRDVAYFHTGTCTSTSVLWKCFNRSSAMWPTST